MHVIIWEYDVRPDRRAEFERRYASDGAWAILFSRARGFLGTRLFRDASVDDRYLTVDRWESQAAFEAFREEFDADYKTLDAECDGLTLDERRIGTIES